MINRSLKILFTLTAIVALAISAGAQDVSLPQQFAAYRQNAFHEKVFVHTDKTGYVAGDLVWFKAYCVDADYHKPLNISKVLYAELIDNAGNAIVQAKVSLANGSGSGSFTVPVTVTNGVYKLRAYTNWMKNFGADYFFEKQITIVNTLNAPEQAKAAAQTYDVQFFPEGGNLVSGLNCNVGFKVTAPNGRGARAFSGAIVNQKNDTVARFAPYKFGMGHFNFTPAANTSYRGVIKIAGAKAIIKELPASAPTGYTLQLTGAGNDEVSVAVTTNAGSGTIYLFAHTGNKTSVIKQADINNGAARFTLSKSALTEGVSHLTIFQQQQATRLRAPLF